MTTTCSPELLESALSGDLPPEREEWLQHHLDECQACAATLHQLAGGDAWRRETAAMLAADELDSALHARDEWSSVDFTVEHLEPADEPDLLGRLGGYDVLEIIGHGGMGVVLKAFDRELKRCIAIKVLSPHLAQSSLARKRFTREAQAAAAVVHPNVMAIHHVQPGGPLPFLVMPLLAGESLAQRLAAQGRLDLTETLRIGMQAAAALAAAHEQGLVHRDVKPANILLEKGVERAMLTDFGLARAADDVSMTRWGIISGTPQYMSPEQARGEPLDGRSDLFSLGCVLYEMATGVSPFRADSMMATLRRLIDDTPQAMSSLNPELPPWFIGIVEHLLEKDPSRRFACAKEVNELLEGCLAHVQQPTSVPLPNVLISLGRDECIAVSARRDDGYDAEMRLRSKPRKPLIIGAIAMFSLLGISLFAVGVVGTAPPDISGRWSGEDWGQVTLTETAPGEYTGTYSDTVVKEKGPGKINLKWSRIERRFNGTWREGDDDRFGTLSIHKVDDQIRGALTTSAQSKVNPETPRLAELVWTLASSAKGSEPSAKTADQKRLNDAAEVMQEGWRLWQGGKLPQAESKFKQAVELDPRNANAWNGLGWSQFNADKDEIAMHSFQKAVQIEPEHPAALNGLGQIYLAQREYSAAEKVLLKAAPQAPAAWCGLARLYLLQGKFEQAEPWAKKVVDSPVGDDVDKLLLKEMLDAAKTKHLTAVLRAKLEPRSAEKMPAVRAPSSPPITIKKFTTTDEVLSGSLAVHDGAWSATLKSPETLHLFEVANPSAEDCKVFYRAKLRTNDFKGQVYLEMWCRFPGLGEAFSRGLDNTLTGTNGWVSCETPFYLKAGERPDLIRLNVVAQGTGTVGVKDVELLRTGLAPGKEKAAVPPKTSATEAVPASQNILKNSGVERGEDTPDGWEQGAAIGGVTYSWCKSVSFEGKASLCIEKTAQRYFPIAQWSQTVDRQGDRPALRVSAQVKAEKMTKAALDVLFVNERGNWVSHKWAAFIGSQAAGEPPANHDWKLYCGTVQIPKAAKKMCIGLQVYGPGKVWFDDIRAEYSDAKGGAEFPSPAKNAADEAKATKAPSSGKNPLPANGSSKERPAP